MGYVTVGVISSLFHCKISLPCHSASELDAPSPIGLRGNLRQRQGTKRWWPGGGAEVRSAGRGRGHHRLSGALKSGTPKGCTIFLSFQRRTSALIEKGDLFHLLTPCDVYGRDPSYERQTAVKPKERMGSHQHLGIGQVAFEGRHVLLDLFASDEASTH